MNRDRQVAVLMNGQRNRLEIRMKHLADIKEYKTKMSKSKKHSEARKANRIFKGGGINRWRIYL